jgi:phage antirepressor YoqD-like protein
MTSIMREVVATELQKVKNLYHEVPKEDSDKIMTREEVCKLLKVSTTTLFHWNNDKVLVNHKIGRRVYYMKADVMAKLINPKTAA